MEALPELLARVAALLQQYPTTWALCGGWAVDAWLGRTTREHCDVDVSVFIDEQAAVRNYFTDGWLLNAHDRVDGDGSQPWDGRVVEFPGHVHAYADGFNLDIQLDRRDGDGWLFGTRVGTLPIEHCIRTSPWGMPTLAPEALLFYKGLGLIRPHDEADFTLLAPTLTTNERAWLRGALAILRPEHQWLAALE